MLNSVENRIPRQRTWAPLAPPGLERPDPVGRAPPDVRGTKMGLISLETACPRTPLNFHNAIAYSETRGDPVVGEQLSRNTHGLLHLRQPTSGRATGKRVRK